MRQYFKLTCLITLIICFISNLNVSGSQEINLRVKIVEDAKEYIGLGYKYGGISNKGFDCSGFVRHIYKLNGINLPRKSIDQYQGGRKIRIENIKIGDLVFFKINMIKITHVGIYIGDGKFIHSPSSGKKIRISMIENSYWKKRLSGAVNYIN